MARNRKKVVFTAPALRLEMATFTGSRPWIAEAGDGDVHGQQALDGPGLAAHLGDDPAALPAEEYERDAAERRDVEPVLVLQLVLPGKPEREEEQQGHEHPQADHQAESPKHYGDGRDHVLRFLQMAVAHVLDVLVQDGAGDGGGVGIAFPELPIDGQGVQRLAAARHLLGDGRNDLPLLVRVAVQDVVDAGNHAVKVVGGEDGQHAGDFDARDDGEGRARAAVPETFGRSQLHGLVLGRMDAG